MGEIAALSAALLLFIGAEEAPQRRYQNFPTFALRLDEVSPDVSGAVLQVYEVYDPAGGAWRSVGPFSLRKKDDKTVGGRAFFEAPREGEYLLRAVARDIAGNAETAGPGPESAELVAVFDRTPPEVRVLYPAGGETFEPGSAVTVVWRVFEENPPSGEAVHIEMSADGGETWRTLASGLRDTGAHRVSLPAEEGSCSLKVSARDICSNRGEGTSPEFYVRAEKEAARYVVEGAPEADGKRAQRERVAAIAKAEAPSAGDRAACLRSYRAGEALFSRGRFLEAAGRFRDAVRSDRSFEAAWTSLGVALARAGSLEAAAEVLREAASGFKRSVELRYDLGLVLFRLGRWEGAERALRDALDLRPGYVEAAWSLGLLGLRTGDLDLARAGWREVVECAPRENLYRDRALSYLKAARSR